MMDGDIRARGFIKEPSCPFCGLVVEPPRELKVRRPGQMPVGSCSCGAVYACDVTGHHGGEAMIEALVFSCDMDWDLAWGLLPEEDYKCEIVDHYDLSRHLLVPGGFYEGRRIQGILFFVRLHTDVLEVTAEGMRRKLEYSMPAMPRRPARRTPGSRRVSKQEVAGLVHDYDVSGLLAAARDDSKVLRLLQRFLYSGDRRQRQRAADMLGQAAAVVGEKDPKAVSNLLQNLFYAVTDTAASSWGAFEAIGEIIANRPDLFGGYMPQLYPFLMDSNRRLQALQALARIASAQPAILRKHTFHFLPLLQDPDPQIRGQAVRLLGFLRAREMHEDLAGLLADEHMVMVYQTGEIRSQSVGSLAREVLENL